MPIVLSLTQDRGQLWAAGPEGLFHVTGAQGGDSLEPIPQPEAELACAAAADGRLLVGGLPHGAAFSADGGATWQASWMDGVEGPVLCFAADPRIAETGVLLAGTAQGGVLRTHNRGRQWAVSNYGLLDYSVLALAWAPPAPAGAWPAWEVAFAATEGGVYRSPNGGLGWRRSTGPGSAAQVVAPAPDFHSSGLVLAGTESEGLWRSTDGGRTFSRLDHAPERVDALVHAGDRWLCSDADSLWESCDGAAWRPISAGPPALVLLATPQGVWAGGEEGVRLIQPA